MAVFTYKATDARAADVTGTIAADTPRQARDLLRQRGPGRQRPGRLPPRRPRRDAAGGRAAARGSRYQVHPLHPRAVHAPRRRRAAAGSAGHHRPPARRAASRPSVLLLRDRVAAGSSLAAAMREQPDVFDDLCVNITEVGEDAGTLDSSLERLAEFRERSQQLTGRVGTALIYPAIVLTTALVSQPVPDDLRRAQILEPLIEQGQALALPDAHRQRRRATSCSAGGGCWLILAAGRVAGVGRVLPQPQRPAAGGTARSCASR